jgi:hypothetical protein
MIPHPAGTPKRRTALARASESDRSLPSDLIFHLMFNRSCPVHFLPKLVPAALRAGLLCTAIAVAVPAFALSGPFAEFNGSWSGSGTIRPEGSNPERIRCNASYMPQGANALTARLRCASDSYNFDLTGELTSNGGNQISGRWTENSRGIGGTVVGTARGDRMQVHVESSGFAATLQMTMQGGRQSVTLDSHGGGQVVKASITMSRH